MHWEFLRSKRNVEVQVIYFSGVRIPGRHGPDGSTVFKAAAEWLDFATKILRALATVRNSMGIDGYEREWRHPFPQEACDKLESAIRLEKSPVFWTFTHRITGAKSPFRLLSRFE